jgi:hypothetical protein
MGHLGWKASSSIENWLQGMSEVRSAGMEPQLDERRFNLDERRV